MSGHALLHALFIIFILKVKCRSVCRFSGSLGGDKDACLMLIERRGRLLETSCGIMALVERAWVLVQKSIDLIWHGVAWRGEAIYTGRFD